ncbi:hypothetical protein ACU5JM_19690 [Rhodococcus erythropolis]|uniref:hypothetical protein n=1 Tax=Rhodococcus erythropolis TaxID=1833 RepID=UPI00406B9EA4
MSVQPEYPEFPVSVPEKYQCAVHPDRYEPCVSCDWLHIRKDPATQWSDDDLRAVSNVLGPQVLIMNLPPVPELPWYSTDEQAGFSVDDSDQITIRTTGPVSPYSAMELATALTAHLANYHHQQTHSPEGTS